MRKLLVLAVLSLAACNENAGWNPNYSMNANTDYGKYLREREVALHGKGPAPTVIPVALPVEAPTAEDIAGAPKKTATKVTVVAAPGAATATVNVPTTTSGPYPGSTPVLVRYAHTESHNPGTRTYQRSGGSVDAAARACRSFQTADAAQTAFLAAGGPILDPRGLDPDGDGFVCGWDPRPLRQSRL